MKNINEKLVYYHANGGCLWADWLFVWKTMSEKSMSNDGKRDA